MHVHIRVRTSLCFYAELFFTLSFEMSSFSFIGEHQMELLDFVAAKFHEEGGVFKLLVSYRWKRDLILSL